ncbi:MAG: M48 family metalloprotease [Candidatus Omnitrophica bacterium]|nr:M48 family metalloprotease [Candidatus Omnitrophota bacterium]
MTSPTESDARRYARIRYRLMLIELVGGLVFLLVYQVSGVSVASARWIARLTPVVWVQLAGYLAIFASSWWAVFSPLRFYGGFLLEHRFGLSRLTVNGWLVREAKHLLVSGVLGLLLMEGWYALLRAFPTTWPVYATLGWVAVSVVLARVFPTWLLPIFYKTTALTDDALARRLLALCERAKVSALGVFRMDLGVETRKANAALAGMGRTRRVLVSDTLLERFTPEEIETILAHELGHQRYRHITKLLMLSGIGSYAAFVLVQIVVPGWFGALGIRNLAEPAGFPTLMLALSLIGLVGLPIQNGISRVFEWQADHFAVLITTQAAAFASALRRLGELNLADPAPPRWVEWLFYDHPPITNRIRAAECGTTVSASSSLP